MKPSLSREQANALFRWKQNALSDLFCSVPDRVEMGSAVISLYRRLLPDANAPKLYFAEGPKQAADLLNKLLGKDVPFNQDGENEPNDFTNARPIRAKLDRYVFNLLKSNKAQIKEALSPGAFRETLNIVFRDFNFQIGQSVYAQVERALARQEGGKTVSEFNPHPCFADWDWLAFYRAVEHSFNVFSDIPDDFHRLLESGFYSGYFYDRFCILIPFPERLSKNENLVLHGEDEPAVAWKDGTSLCFWNGIHVPEKLILFPNEISAGDILEETNAEVRRCYQEKLGSERFGTLLGLIELDRKSDRFGNDSILFRTKLRDKLAGDFIYFAKVICPSTGRSYFLCVPPWMRGIDEAVSWTFGKKPGDYKPSLET